MCADTLMSYILKGLRHLQLPVIQVQRAHCFVLAQNMCSDLELV